MAVRRHRPSAQARRDALLRAAIEVAAERGTAGVTHKAVTERAGLPLATASYFFSSIDELVAEAFQEFAAEEATRLEALAAELAEDQRRPEEIAGLLAEASMPDPLFPWTMAQFEVYLEAARNPALRDHVADALAAYRRVAEVALAAAGVPDAGVAADAFCALVDGFALHHLARPRRADMAAVRTACRMLFLGLLVEQGDLDRAAGLAPSNFG